MSQFGKEAEDRLIGCMRQVQGLVSDGEDPTQAIVKVAKENQVHSDMLPLMVQAYNTGRQTFQRDKCGAEGKGILCKVADFPIARLEDVREALYPTKVAEVIFPTDPNVVSTDYSAPPRPFQQDVQAAREKVASAKVRMTEPPKPLEGQDPHIKMAKIYGRKDRAERRVKAAEQNQRIARERFLLAIGQVGEYFKQAEYARLPMHEVGYNARALYGEAALDTLRYAAARNRTPLPDFNKAPKIARPVDPSQAPYTLIKLAIDRCQEAVEAAREAQRLTKEASAEVEDLFRPFCPKPVTPPTRVLDTPQSRAEKKAGLFGSLAAGLSGGTAASIGQSLSAKPTTELVDDISLELNDPAHVDELRQIEARAVLNDMMANDEVVSGYDPDEVANAYNEIVATSPSLATQPLALRPLLRKRLSAGAMEPFEAQQAAEIEKTIRQTGRAREDELKSPILV